MGGLVVQPQRELREDTLGDVRGGVALVPLVEDRDVVGESSGGVGGTSGQKERSVATQEKTRRGRDRQHWEWSWEDGRAPERKRCP